MKITSAIALGLATALASPVLLAQTGVERRPAAAPEAAAPEDGARPARSEDDLAARRLLQQAFDLKAAGESERAVKMHETILDQYPASPVRFEALLALGKHYAEANDAARAVNYLNRLKELEKPDQEMTPEVREIFLEGLYTIGVVYYHTKQFQAAFPVLRKITTQYPNSLWANQSYYYVGMCHFAQGNWNRAIEALALVGTFVDPDSPTIEYAEAGHRLYVKIQDNDLPVLQRLGRKISVELESASGDKEAVEAVSLADKQGLFIAALATDIGPAKPNDGVLQIVGGDTVTTRYYDDNTKEGQKDVLREKKVRVVSTASLAFTSGTFESKAPAAFMGQPLFVLLQDADLDRGAERDTTTVRILSRYKVEDADAAAPAAGDNAARQEEQFKVRDEVTLNLSEVGDAPVRSGKFQGQVRIDPFREGQAVDKNDQALTCALGDEVLAMYVDEMHIGGASPRSVNSKIKVVGEIDSSPRATANDVPETLIRSRKNLVESAAFLELARIFKAMGLTEGAGNKAREGLERADAVIKIEGPLPSVLKEEAFKLKWELYITMEDYASAIATCSVFNKLYPNSPFVDQALMGIGAIKLGNREYNEAIKVFQQVLDLKVSQAKAEAQFRIAQALESKAVDAALLAAAEGKAPVAAVPPGIELAMQQYKVCADRYGDSQFAGNALAKLVEYYIKTKDFGQANDLIEQTFQDHPDAVFLDEMLLQWTLVAYQMGNFQKAYDKCSQLLFEFPNSPRCQTAKTLLPRIEARLGKTSSTPDPDAGDGKTGG